MVKIGIERTGWFEVKPVIIFVKFNLNRPSCDAFIPCVSSHQIVTFILSDSLHCPQDSLYSRFVTIFDQSSEFLQRIECLTRWRTFQSFQALQSYFRLKSFLLRVYIFKLHRNTETIVRFLWFGQNLKSGCWGSSLNETFPAIIPTKASPRSS